MLWNVVAVKEPMDQQSINEPVSDGSEADAK